MIYKTYYHVFLYYTVLLYREGGEESEEDIDISCILSLKAILILNGKNE